MSLKDIREYIHLAMEGDSTIEERLQLFYRQRQILQAQMKELQHTMDVLDFKCWYYETARDAGTDSGASVHVCGGTSPSVSQLKERSCKGADC